MYTVKMCDDKSLLVIDSTPIYINENNIDTINIFIPTEFNNIDITQFNVTFNYLLPNGVLKSSIIVSSESQYDGYSLYPVPISSDFTQISGKIIYWLEITNGNIILESASSTIVVNKIY